MDEPFHQLNKDSSYQEFCVNIIGSSPDNNKKMKKYQVGQLTDHDQDQEETSDKIKRSRSLRIKSTPGPQQSTGRGKIILRQRSYMNVMMRKTAHVANASPSRNPIILTDLNNEGSSSPYTKKRIQPSNSCNLSQNASSPKLSRVHPLQRKILRSRSAYITPVRYT